MERKWQWELTLTDGRRVVWEGTDGEDAARRYVADHREDAVIAWRSYPRHGFFVGNARNIIEPGDPRW